MFILISLNTDDDTNTPAWPRVCLSERSSHKRNDAPPIKPDEKELMESNNQQKPLPTGKETTNNLRPYYDDVK